MEVETIIELIRKYEAGTLTPEEKGLLESWYLSQAGKRRPLPAEELESRLRRVELRLPAGRQRVKRRAFLATAAILGIAVAAALYFYKDTFTDRIPQQPLAIIPGGNKASITLADGRTIELREDKAGVIVGEQLAYDDGTAIAEASPKAGSAEKPPEQLISTPRGGQYQVVLPDGTKVWLNAASSLRYPVFFAGGTREVELSGEAFFEVAEDRTKPFKVHLHQQEIEVLGTSFNVSAYADDPVSRTVLVEGRVKVSGLMHDENGEEITESRELRPGHEAVWTAGHLQVGEADTAAATAWKNGIFSFDDESLESIMRKIARWYDVEVVFKGADPGERFSGGVSRYDQITTVLQRLEMAGNVRFEIKERRIIVQ